MDCARRGHDAAQVQLLQALHACKGLHCSRHKPCAACTAQGPQVNQPCTAIHHQRTEASQCMCENGSLTKYTSHGINHVVAQGPRVSQPYTTPQRLAKEDSLWYLLVPTSSRCGPPCQLWCIIPEVWRQRTEASQCMCVHGMGASQNTHNGMSHVSDCFSGTHWLVSIGTVMVHMHLRIGCCTLPPKTWCC